MKKRFTGIILAALVLLLMTSCQYIDQAIEDTFRPLPEKYQSPEEKNRGVFEKIIAFFAESKYLETGMNLTIFDVRDDVFAKLELEDPISDFDSFVMGHIRRNEIDRYLSLEEAQDLLNLFNSQNLILNPERTIQALEDLTIDLGWDKVYVRSGRITIYRNRIFLDLHNPENYTHVDTYNYDAEAGNWTSYPARTVDSENPLEDSLLITDIPLESLYMVRDACLEVVKEIGEYNEAFPYENASSFKGIQNISIYVGWRNGKDVLGIRSAVRGERENITLEFDSDGNLIEKRR